MFSLSRIRDRCASERRARVGVGLYVRQAADDGCCCQACPLHLHSFDALEIGANGELAMLSRRKTFADRIKHPATP
jgi:CO dehydrogenase/acetyl-CoA synthase alpha subunit